MKGVDLSNQLSSYWAFDYQQNKWCRSVFIRINYISIGNAYILNNKNFLDKSLSFKEFLGDLTKKLLYSLVGKQILQIIPFNK